MFKCNSMSRRAALGLAGTGSMALANLEDFVRAADKAKVNGNIPQSVCAWCYRIPLDKLAPAAAAMGYKSIELLWPDEFKIVKPHGLTCAMLKCRSIPEGLNRQQYHPRIVEELTKHIEFAADNGIPNVICMSGNRKGMSNEEGLDNCVIGLKQVIGLAEKKKVNICMELLNSKVDHKDYMCDRTPWGVALVKKLGSDRFKLLYDIYHMQIMEGDVIRTIRDNKDYIAHYHTGGVPGRHEIDESQELYYPAIIKAILQTGFKGFLGQEFIPSRDRDPLASLSQGFRICDV